VTNRLAYGESSLSSPKPPGRAWGPTSRSSFSGGKRLGREAEHPPLSNAEVKNEWSYNSTLHMHSWPALAPYLSGYIHGQSIPCLLVMNDAADLEYLTMSTVVLQYTTTARRATPLCYHLLSQITNTHVPMNAQTYRQKIS
jgi:hypothetical protein